MTVLTPTEQAFLTMAKMVDHKEAWSKSGNRPGTIRVMIPRVRPFDGSQAEVDWTARTLHETPAIFPIVASTFEALTIERPELRDHYERAKEAWEASQ